MLCSEGTCKVCIPWKAEPSKLQATLYCSAGEAGRIAKLAEDVLPAVWMQPTDGVHWRAVSERGPYALRHPSILSWNSQTSCEGGRPQNLEYLQVGSQVACSHTAPECRGLSSAFLISAAQLQIVWDSGELDSAKLHAGPGPLTCIF